MPVQNKPINVYGLKLAVSHLVHTARLLSSLKKEIYYDSPIDKSEQEATLDALRWTLKEISVDFDFYNFYKQTKKSSIKLDIQVLHGLLSYLTELSELGSALLVALENDSLTQGSLIAILEEIGDLEWIKAVLLDKLGVHEDTVRAMNRAKIVTRYPDNGFSYEKAQKRNKEAEHLAMQAEYLKRGHISD